MIIKFNRRLAGSAALVSALAVAGCTGETDPSKAGLFDNLSNLNSGEYERQIAAGEAEAARIVRDNRAREASIASLNNQQAANSATAARLRSQIAAAQTELSSARAKNEGDPAKLAQLNNLDRQLASVRQASASGGSESVLRAEVASIRSAIRVLSK